MGWRKDFLIRYTGFTAKTESLQDMDINFLYALASEDAENRYEEGADSTKAILFDKDAYEKSSRLLTLRDDWNPAKLEPLDIKKEGSLYMIDNGFHRIRVMRDMGFKTAPVRLQEGKFHLSKQVSFADLPNLLDMLKALFPQQKTIEALEATLGEITKNAKKEKLEHTFITYRVE